MSRSKQVWMKSCRQIGLRDPVAAKKLSGNPPRTYSWLCFSGGHFQHIQRRKLDIGDAPGEGFGLPQQLDRCQPQKQEAARFFAPPAALVDQPAQCCEQLRRPLYFVEDDQLVFMPGEVEGGG